MVIHMLTVYSQKGLKIRRNGPNFSVLLGGVGLLNCFLVRWLEICVWIYLELAVLSSMKDGLLCFSPKRNYYYANC